MTSPEAWLRGPVEGVPAVLQPIAHALLQAREESRRLLENFPPEMLWTRPAGLASIGFHLQHITGVVDRLFTYARGESLSTPQQETLAREGHQPGTGGSIDELLDALDAQVDRALDQLRATQPQTLADARAVGRKRLPSTVQGLLFYAAEHAQRHVGQLLVTARMLQKGGSGLLMPEVTPAGVPGIVKAAVVLDIGALALIIWSILWIFRRHRSRLQSPCSHISRWMRSCTLNWHCGRIRPSGREHGLLRRSW